MNIKCWFGHNLETVGVYAKEIKDFPFVKGFTIKAMKCSRCGHIECIPFLYFSTKDEQFKAMKNESRIDLSKLGLTSKTKK